MQLTSSDRILRVRRPTKMKNSGLVTSSRRTTMAPVVGAFVLLILQIRITVVVDAQCSTQEVLTDSCLYRQDGECDADGTFCPVNTDCFDCDPCRIYDGLGCQDCVAGGCSYCTRGDGVGICSSPAFADAIPLACLASEGTPYATICEGGGDEPVHNDACDVLNDPCYFAQDGECDANGRLCPINSDCFDCDPFRRFGSLGCDECTSNGGAYCQTGYGEGICSSLEIATAVPSYCQDDGGTAYTAECGDDVGDVPSGCDVLNDPCPYAVDAECDAGDACPFNTDCFDCDPFQQYRDLGCQSCVDNGGRYCETGIGIPICSSPEIAAALPNVCIDSSDGTAYTAVCDDEPIVSDTCDVENDSCQYQNDGECDAGSFCAPNSDCYDCSPCTQLRFDGCDACTAAGCLWCAADAACFPDYGGPVPSRLECTSADFVSTCPGTTNANPFSDPLYESSNWIFDMIRVKPVWESGITGSGIGIRINDDGVDANHPDLSSNFDVNSSCPNYLPQLLNPKNGHGTACASLAAAAGDNNVCSVGVAPGATLSSCRVFDDDGPDILAFYGYPFLTENMENMDISSNSYGAETCSNPDRQSRSRRLQNMCPFSQEDDEYSPCATKTPCSEDDWNSQTLSARCESYVVRYCSVLFENDVQACTAYLDLFVECQYFGLENDQLEAFVTGVTEGRDGKGIIYIYASGNSYDAGADVNFDGTLNSRFTISVGAVGKDGKHASYSTPGAALFVTAPGGDRETYTNNVVALPGGGCHDITIGTSFSAPIVSGVVALILQANGALTWRDVQGVIATTSQKMQPEDPSWTTNAAGIHHSNLYGFGVIDASAGVTAAQSWINYSSEQTITAESGTINLAIEDSPNDPVSSVISVEATGTFETESVVVYLSLSHSSRGDLDVSLISPSGTESLLHPGQRPENTQEDERWKLMTVRNWNEPANGDWTLRIADRSEGDVDPSQSSTPDVLISWRIMVYGHTSGGGIPVSAPVSAPDSTPAPASGSAPPTTSAPDSELTDAILASLHNASTTINGNDADPNSTAAPAVASPPTDPPTVRGETTTRDPTGTTSSSGKKCSALSVQILFVCGLARLLSCLL